MFQVARPRIQSLSVEREELISFVSFMRSGVWYLESAAASLPARSTKKSRPSGQSESSLFSFLIRQMACEREEALFLSVGALARKIILVLIRSRKSSIVEGGAFDNTYQLGFSK